MFLTQRTRENKLWTGKYNHAKSRKDTKGITKQIDVEVVGIISDYPE